MLFRSHSLLAAVAVAAATSPCAFAQPYPAKQIRMIVPFPPGGPNDILGRVVATNLSQQLGQQVVVDNRGGAGGIIGAEIAARSAADGYTILLSGTASMAINPGLHKKLPYDPLKDFAPVSMLGTAPSLLTVHPSQPIKTVKDLIALAQAKPGKLNFVSAGHGTPPHLAGELFKNMTGVNMVHVPYKGGGPALADLLAGQVELYFSGISSVLPFVKENRLRGIAVTSAKRTAVLPDTPTVIESGLAGFEVSNWYAVAAPAATAPAIIKRLNAEILTVLTVPELKKRFFELAADPFGSTPEQLAAYNRSEITKWARAIKAAGITPE